MPGTTTITGLLNKPFLITWANRLGLEGILTSETIVEQIISENPSLAKRIMNWLKDFVAELKNIMQDITGRGRKEIVALQGNVETVQKIYDLFDEGMKAAKETIEIKAADTVDVKYAKKEVDGKQYVEADCEVIHGDNPEEWAKQVEGYINKQIRNGKDVTVYTSNGVPLRITADTAGKASFRNYVTLKDGSRRLMTDEEYAVKLRAETHIDELGEVSRGVGKTVPDTKNHPFAKDGFNYRVAYFKDNTGYYKLTISVGKNGKINTIYNVGKIEEANFPTKGLKGPTRSKTETGKLASDADSISQDDIQDNNIIRENNKNDTQKVKQSLKDISDIDGDTKQLISENAEMRKAEDLLREQFELTRGRSVNRKGVNAIANKLPQTV